MAKHQFQKGNTFGSAGRPKMTAEEKQLALLTRTKIQSLIRKYLLMTPKEMRSAYRKKDILMIDKMIMKIIESALMKADQVRLDWLLKQIL